MSVNGVVPLNVNKVNRNNVVNEVGVHSRRHDKQDMDTANTGRWRRDGFDSAPALDHYNNYSKNGTLMVNVTDYYKNDATMVSHVDKTDNYDAGGIAEVANDVPMSEVDRLAQALRENEEYMRLISGFRGTQGANFWNLRDIPEWHELGLQLIKDLSSEDYELVQKMLWSHIANVHADEAWRDTQHGLTFFSDAHARSSDGRRNLPLLGSHKNYDLVSIWKNMNAPKNTVNGTLGEVFAHVFHSFLNLNMRVNGSTEAQRTFDPQLIHLEERFGPNATFGNRMSSVADHVNMLFNEARQALPTTDRFSITFNSNFSFNVSGGTGNNSEFLQGILNNAGGWLLSHVIDALFTHRGENGEIPRWLATNHEHDMWRMLAEDFRFEYIQATEEFLEELERVRSAYARKLTEEWLQEQFGFGLDDLLYEDGVLSGRTQEISDVVKSDQRFEQFMYLSRTKHCASIHDALNTPKEKDLSFINIVFENGEFSISYG
jgi:hypothetical protein